MSGLASPAAPLGAGLLVELDHAPDLLALQRAAPALFPLLLESAARGPRGRFDLLLACAGEGLLKRADGGVTDLAGAALDAPDFLTALAAATSRGAARQPAPHALPFHGGWGLFLAYEIAGEIEPSLRLPADPMGLPQAVAWRCPVAVVVDHGLERSFLVAEADAGALLARVEAAVLQAAETAGPEAPAPAELGEADPADYLEGVRRSLDYIAAGDVFQVNLSRRWQGRLDAADPAHALYAALRANNPAPFSALAVLPDGSAVVSSSPERLVSRRGQRLETRPIAGTRPRQPGEDDADRIRELVAHPKERAEHIMLIDLERNDLGRVCRAGSVRVDELMAVESYAHVHHIESTVSGDAREGVGLAEVIRAVFPGGTITGCPKVRCMQIIAELEGEGRGAYTGALGWLDGSGDFDLNILIRSFAVRGGEFCFRAGAGVVADSDPARELEETRAKARGLLRALGVAG
ncbi:aminodeoxychorismate synthase component I [Pseudomarimonas salicorniae]|uniref:Aminodeoxychorismate synthase component I n=1 Tax=Pseudomarimonas salicorniae TaxID=2933270 RepID=A0ABT0GJJ5_9GAMM|nr:aminodeoxychorismate synthase component I [Lysobacter sp. CAU 1642]MCK7594724.1 aminodeoxychorismate synthase component I [Lysobacter sp. CAU 1642]